MQFSNDFFYHRSVKLNVNNLDKIVYNIVMFSVIFFNFLVIKMNCVFLKKLKSKKALRTAVLP